MSFRTLISFLSFSSLLVGRDSQVLGVVTHCSQSDSVPFRPLVLVSGVVMTRERDTV